MTSLLPTPCAHPGCPAIVRTRYCAIHLRQVRQQQDARRPSSTRRGYDARWRQIRVRFLAMYPMCGDCRQARATEVDHAVPRAAGGTDEWRNLRARCKSCHSRKTMRQSVARV